MPEKDAKRLAMKVFPIVAPSPNHLGGDIFNNVGHDYDSLEGIKEGVIQMRLGNLQRKFTKRNHQAFPKQTVVIFNPKSLCHTMNRSRRPPDSEENARKPRRRRGRHGS